MDMLYALYIILLYQSLILSLYMTIMICSVRYMLLMYDIPVSVKQSLVGGGYTCPLCYHNELYEFHSQPWQGNVWKKIYIWFETLHNLKENIHLIWKKIYIWYGKVILVGVIVIVVESGKIILFSIVWPIYCYLLNEISNIDLFRNINKLYHEVYLRCRCISTIWNHMKKVCARKGSRKDTILPVLVSKSILLAI